jgi:general secretion pathway protein K
MPADKAGGRRFVTIEELKLVPGMTSQRFERIAPMVTVYSGRDGLDANLAPKDLLVALLGLATVDAEEVIRMRAVAAQQAEDLEAVPRRAPTGRAFEIKARVARVDGTSLGRVAVIRVTGYLSTPVWVYRCQI